MGEKEKNRWIWLLKIAFLYCCFPLILFHGVFALFHPERVFLTKFLAQIEENTGIRIHYAEIRTAFPFSLIFFNVQADQIEERVMDASGEKYVLRPRRYFSADALSIGLSYKSLMRIQAGVDISADTYGGKITGTISTAFNTTPNKPFKMVMAWEEIGLDRLSVDFPDLPIKKGVSAGDARWTIDPVRYFGITGPVKLEIDHVDFLLPEKVRGALDIPSISKFTGDIQLNGPLVLVNEIWAFGEMGSVSASGSIERDIDPDKSRLDMELRLYPHPGGGEIKKNQYIPITVAGTAKNPVIDFLGFSFDRGSVR